MKTFQVAEPLPATGSTLESGSGKSTASPWKPSRISWSSWRPSPQGASCRSCAVRSTEPAFKHPESRIARSASTAAAMPPFMSEAPLPVSSPSSHFRRRKRQVDCIQMAVELKRRPGRAAVKSNGHRGGGWISPRWPCDGEPVGLEQPRQAVGCGPGVSGRAWNFNQGPRGRDQPLGIDVRFHAFEIFSVGVHEVALYPRGCGLSTRRKDGLALRLRIPSHSGARPKAIARGAQPRGTSRYPKKSSGQNERGET